MKRTSILFFITSFFLFTCGLEESFYLPQVPQNRIIRTNNTEAVITLPSIAQYDYAKSGVGYYSILYKIYISDYDHDGDIQASTERSKINSSLNSDYNLIYPSTDPITTTSSNGYNILRNRNYLELELFGEDIRNILQPSGGRISIHFPTGSGEYYPTMSLNDASGFTLRRSSDLISPQPDGDPSFRNTLELSNPANATVNVNVDVSSSSEYPLPFAYVSMYVIAVGINYTAFTPIYSKPTHISIFKLPNNY